MYTYIYNTNNDEINFSFSTFATKFSHYNASSIIQTSLIRNLAYPNFVWGRSDIIKLLTCPQHYALYARALALQKAWFCHANPTAGSSQAVKQQHGSRHVHRKAKASCFIHCFRYPNISLIRTTLCSKGFR